MITKITLSNVASYKDATSLETDKRINLIYGLNGSGKTVIANHLQNIGTDEDDVDTEEDEFVYCSIEGFDKKLSKNIGL